MIDCSVQRAIMQDWKPFKRNCRHKHIMVVMCLIEKTSQMLLKSPLWPAWNPVWYICTCGQQIQIKVTGSIFMVYDR